MAELDERSTGYLTVTFRDKDGLAAQPTSSWYAIFDVATGNTVRAATSLAPTAGVVEITLDVNDNTMVDSSKAVETRRVIVVATFGVNDELDAEYKYRLNNLNGVPLASP